MPSNTAAWQPSPGTTFEIKSTPYTSPSANEIVIKNHALAINPIDYKLQDVALFPFLTYPTILGADIAGEVVEVGSNVTSFKPGDRVLAHAPGSTSNKPSHSAFQEYTVGVTKLASYIPDSLSYTDASVLPVGVSTASCGLFQKDHLALQHPSLSPKPTGQTLLVWSGASSVGVNAIQLAIAAGYRVIATASPKNSDLLRGLGASEVLDYNAAPANLLEQLVSAFENKTIAGVIHTAGDAVGPISICADLFSRVPGNHFFTTTMLLPEADKIPDGFKHSRIFGAALEHNEVGDVIYGDFLSKALAAGKYKAAPAAEVVGDGLESLQKGIDVLRRGVSAQKLVVTLS